MSFIHRNSLVYQRDILSLVQMETAYMNTMHAEFIRKPFQINRNGHGNKNTEIGQDVSSSIDEIFLDGFENVSFNLWLWYYNLYWIARTHKKPFNFFSFRHQMWIDWVRTRKTSKIFSRKLVRICASWKRLCVTWSRRQSRFSSYENCNNLSKKTYCQNRYRSIWKGIKTTWVL